MNILSIDFDYFSDVTEDQIDLFPDGIDQNTRLSEIVWATHYAMHGEEIEEIGIREDELSYLKELLAKQNEDIPVLIANSHLNIYDFIKSQDGYNDKLYLANVDMHHDVLNENNDLDCGNWIGHLIDERSVQKLATRFEWAVNPISLDVYGIGEMFDKGGELEGVAKNSISELKRQNYDAVFLCRSDTWTPPHLDGYFTDLCDFISAHFENVEIRDGVDIPREEYRQIAEQEKEMRKEIQREVYANGL